MDDILDRIRERDRATTHWDGCEKSHIRCAAAREIRGLRERVAELEGDGARQPDVAAALFTFAGWLTTRDTPITFGGTFDAAPVAHAVWVFCKQNRIPGADMKTNLYCHPDEDAMADAAREAGR